MVEPSVRLREHRAVRRLVLAIAAALIAGVFAAGASAGRTLAHEAALDAPLAAVAGRSFDRALIGSPAVVLATAGRVAGWRPLVDRAVRGTGVDPDLLEAMVYVESGGRAAAIAGHDPASPVGLTQLSPAAARVVGVQVHLGASRRLTRMIWVASREHRASKVLELAARRRVRDRRFTPVGSLRGTVRFLERATRRLGRADLAVASYHLGVANLTAATGGHRIPFAVLYFSSAPDRHVALWRRLVREGAVAEDYYWKVLGAERIMRAYRTNRAGLLYEARLQARKSSAEEVLHPRSETLRFRSPRDLVRAWARHELVAIPRTPNVTHIAIGKSFGQMARNVGRSRRLYRGLRPDALHVLLFIGRRVAQLSHAHRPLILTSAVRDGVYQRVLTHVNPNATRAYSLHTTGYAFDIARRYASGRQAAAFQYVLDRLSALRAIAYIRESATIHIAVAANVSLALLRRVV
jgi:hypothetical protein